MNKKLTAIISAVVVLLIVVGIGLFIHFNNNDDVLDESSYSSVELSAENILFTQNSNKPNIELLLDEELFTVAFDSKAIDFSFRKADRIRIHFSDGKKFEIEPDDETVKVKKEKDIVRIKMYVDKKDVFETANKLIKFDTACSVKIFFDEGTFELNGEPTKAVTFMLKCESKPVSDVEKAYMKVTYENYVMKLSLTDFAGNELYFTASGNTNDYITVYTDKENEYSFNSRIVITDLFRTAVLNPSNSLDMNKDIFVYVPDGFFVSEEGNRIQVIGLKDSAANIKMGEATQTEEQTDTEDTQIEVLSTQDGVSVIPTFDESALMLGISLRILTDLEIDVITDIDLESADLSARIVTSADTYDVDPSAIECIKSEILGGYVINISMEDESAEIGSILVTGMALKDEYSYDIEVTATGSDGKALAKISAPIEN